MKIIKNIAVNSECYKESKKMIPQGIVIHSTGVNEPRLDRYMSIVNRFEQICGHAYVGINNDNELCVTEVLPLDICCKDIGYGQKGSFNNNPPYIQLEICEDCLMDDDYYIAVFDIAAEYCAYLCRTFGLDIRKIVSHKEAYEMGFGSNYHDPEYWMRNFGETMGDFRRKVASILNISDISDIDDVVGKDRILPGYLKFQYLDYIQQIEGRYPYGGYRGYFGTSRTKNSDIGT